jgi:hypothetical protein
MILTCGCGGAKVNLQGLVGLLHFYSQDVRPKVSDETLRKGEPDHRRADHADAPQQQPETEPARCEAKLTAQTARTQATSPKIKTSPNRNPLVGASLSERGTLADLD